MRMSNPLNILIRPREDEPVNFRWAVVTQADPLRVRIETEAEPLAGKPSTLVAGLEADERVFVLIHRNRATILGRAGG